MAENSVVSTPPRVINHEAVSTILYPVLLNTSDTESSLVALSRNPWTSQAALSSPLNLRCGGKKVEHPMLLLNRSPPGPRQRKEERKEGVVATSLNEKAVRCTCRSLLLPSLPVAPPPVRWLVVPRTCCNTKGTSVQEAG